MKEIYLISGLGADKRVFEHLQLNGFKLNHIEWIIPAEAETIQSYAAKLCAQIHSERPILIGVSFGGMIAIEIGKLIETEKIVIISSAKTVVNLPGFSRMAKLNLHAMIPISLLKYPNEVLYWLFGVNGQQEKLLLSQIVRDTDGKFLKWALGKVFSWANTTELENVISIHGTRDRLIPFTKADFIIAKGGHLMILSRHQEINELPRKDIKMTPIAITLEYDLK